MKGEELRYFLTLGAGAFTNVRSNEGGGNLGREGTGTLRHITGAHWQTKKVAY